MRILYFCTGVIVGMMLMGVASAARPDQDQPPTWRVVVLVSNPGPFRVDREVLGPMKYREMAEDWYQRELTETMDDDTVALVQETCLRRTVKSAAGLHHLPGKR